MDPREVLLTLAQVGVTLAALSGVAGIIESRRTDLPQHAISIRLLRDVALLGMLAALFAILPPVFVQDAAMNGTGVWRSLSAIGAIVWVAGYGAFLYDALKAVRAGSFSWLDILFGLVPTLFGLGLLGSNVFDPSAASPQRYMLAMICVLAIAGLNFLAGAFGFRVRPPTA
jgi:hypothetical protein